MIRVLPRTSTARTSGSNTMSGTTHSTYALELSMAVANRGSENSRSKLANPMNAPRCSIVESVKDSTRVLMNGYTTSRPTTTIAGATNSHGVNHSEWVLEAGPSRPARRAGRDVTGAATRSLTVGCAKSQFPDNRELEYSTDASSASCADFSPVSYTHLRAHETRHDLVCRLLLEK